MEALKLQDSKTLKKYMVALLLAGMLSHTLRLQKYQNQRKLNRNKQYNKLALPKPKIKMKKLLDFNINLMKTKQNLQKLKKLKLMLLNLLNLTKKQ